MVHSAQYRRKPRGRPAGLGDEHDWRFSFCCARDGCRTRKTPPSLRFLGRKVYLAAMVVLIAIMREGVTAARMRQLSGLVGVDRRTVERWREWWRDTSRRARSGRSAGPYSCRRSIRIACRPR